MTERTAGECVRLPIRASIWLRQRRSSPGGDSLLPVVTTIRSPPPPDCTVSCIGQQSPRRAPATERRFIIWWCQGNPLRRTRTAGSRRDRRDPAPCPICRSLDTAPFRTDVVDFEYFVVPPRPFIEQRCGRCGSQFLDPRPTEAELPPFYPSDYHAYNENHGAVARLLVEARARARARSYGRLIPGGRGRIFDVGTGRLPPLRRTAQVHRPRVRRRRDPARDRRQGTRARLRRDRRDPRGGRPVGPPRPL